MCYHMQERSRHAQFTQSVWLLNGSVEPLALPSYRPWFESVHLLGGLCIRIYCVSDPSGRTVIFVHFTSSLEDSLNNS